MMPLLRFLTVLTLLVVPHAAANDSAVPRQQLRTALPVESLGAGGVVTAYTFGCALHIWSLPTGRVTKVNAASDCSADPKFPHVTIAADEVVMSQLEEHNHLYSSIDAVSSSEPKKWRNIYSGTDAGIGALAAEEETIAFSTQEGPSYDGPYATLWRGTTRSVSEVTTATGWMDHIAVERDVVALGYRDGRVRVFGKNGERVLALPAGTAVGGVALDRGRLLTLAQGRLAVRTLGGALVASRRTRGRASRKLLDAWSGLATYRTGTTLRLLRLSDGRDIALRTPKTDAAHLHARFGELGLVVAHFAVPSKPSRGGIVRLIRRVALDRLLGHGS